MSDGEINYVSLFAGIGGFDLAFDRAGMKCVAQVEKDEKARDVLSRHWPDVKKYTDVKEFGNEQLKRGAADLVCGGFPCQDLSIAGKRKGLAGERSGLWFEFERIIDELEPKWVVIENVPGLLSSNGGRDFAVVLQGLVKRRYGVCWRILDAQYFGVPQRRKRVFVVGSLGSGRSAEVLFESEGLHRDTPPSRKEGQGFTSVAGTLASSGGGLDRPAGNANELDFCIPIGIDSEMNASENKIGTLRSHQSGGSELFVTSSEVATTIDAGEWRGPNRNQVGNFVARSLTSSNQRNDFETENFVVWDKLQETSVAHRTKPQSELSYTLNGAGQMMVGVRRLTPTECARLQGFPDDWNDWLADTVRYRQFGNAVAVPPAEWIGRRIVRANA